MRTRATLLTVAAAGVAISAYMHFYLYFWGGYRAISIDRIAGLDISRSFALNAIVGIVIAELLVLSVRFRRLAVPAAILGVGFAAGALGAYTLSRTSGLLGFTENQWTTEAVISKLAELVALIALGTFLVTSLTERRPTAHSADTTPAEV